MKMNREEWLTAMMDELRPFYREAGAAIPKNIKVTCGFPHRGGAARKRRVYGEVHPPESSKANVYEIFVSPVISDSVMATAVLAHELVRCSVGLEHKHGWPYLKVARQIGIGTKYDKKDFVTDTFKSTVKPFIKALGDYPHEELKVYAAEDKQTTRLVKCVCGQCGYPVRVTRTWLTKHGAPLCPHPKHKGTLMNIEIGKKQKKELGM